MRGRGEGTIFKRTRKTKDGREIVTWVAELSPEVGKRITRYAKSQREAQALLKEMKQAVDTGRPAKPTRETVAAFLERWLDVKKGKAPKTHASYAQQVRLYISPALGYLRLNDVSPAHLQRLVSELATDRPSTAQHVLTTIKAAFGLAVGWGLIPTNPASDIEKPKHRPKPVAPLSYEQASAVLAAFEGHRLEAYVTFMLDTGARPSEALALTWDHIDLGRGTARIMQSLPMGGGRREAIATKTPKGNRTVPLMERTLAALRRRQAEQRALGLLTPWVFDRGDGEPANETVVYHQVAKHLSRCGLDHLSLYALRHGAATMGLENGESLKDIAERLGHSTVVTTADRYLHISEGRLREATRSREQRLSR